jgi:hypothetical protein
MELHLFPTSEDCTVGFLFLYPLTCILIHPHSTLHPFIMVSCLVYWSGRDLDSPSSSEVCSARHSFIVRRGCRESLLLIDEPGLILHWGLVQRVQRVLLVSKHLLDRSGR